MPIYDPVDDIGEVIWLSTRSCGFDSRRGLSRSRSKETRFRTVTPGKAGASPVGRANTESPTLVSHAVLKTVVARPVGSNPTLSATEGIRMARDPVATWVSRKVRRFDSFPFRQNLYIKTTKDLTHSLVWCIFIIGREPWKII